ncbi:response regulator [Paenibacillus sp. 1P07SE]|uniref:response regulator n=1 Tax=Paenibacillus sp. 1P07SE TaxID=3132209 RepID=UPI0039A48085
MASIMIVDDAAFMRGMLRDILERGGHQIVCEATNGEEAVRSFSTYKPDLVTMDITMPYMDGVDAVKEIVVKDPAAKIVMCSAMGHQPMIIRAVQAGAKDFILKPFRPERVLAAIDKVICS